MDDLIATDALSSAARRHRAAQQALVPKSKPRQKGREWKVLRNDSGDLGGLREQLPEVQISHINGQAASIAVNGREFAVNRDEAGRFTGIEEQ